MESYGIPRNIIHMVKMFCEDSECTVLDEVRNLIGSRLTPELNKSGFIFILKLKTISTELKLLYRLDTCGLDNEKKQKDIKQG